MTTSQTLCRATYQGDAALAGLLAKARSGYDVSSLRVLIAGVLAAPPAVDETAWTRLVAEDVSPALQAQLLALHGEMSAAAVRTTSDAAERLAAVRAELKKLGVHGFLVPSADEHQGEYVPRRAHRLGWLTGFTGSMGLAVVLQDEAAIFVDGRYTIQVRAEVDATLYHYRHLTEEPATEWVAQTLTSGQVLGYDPRLHTIGDVDRFRAAAERAGGSVRPLDGNPLDAAWADQPPPPIAPVDAHETRFAGESSEEKRRRLGESLAKDGLDAAILTSPDSIAWLLNVRGGDVSRTPLPLSFAMLRADASVTLFIDRRKLVPGLERHLGNAVAIEAPDRLGAAIDELGGAGQRVAVDPSTASSWVFDRLAASGANVQRGPDPCTLPKALKNPVELEGTRAAHRRDGAAMARFLGWLDAHAGSGTLREIDVSDRLEQFRRVGEHFRDLSFDTISGAGSNGAIVHYRSTPKTEKPLETGSLYLVDSGAQYLDGTTDITRTIAIGTPSAEMKDRFTRVLKGHIAIATCRFPKGTTGSQIDVLARHALWQVGLDYDHGTGHGVGSYLSVHEGPHRISKVGNTQALLPGMIVSNEPGYYKTGAYGIRIENLVAVTALGDIPGAEREMFGFETLTLAPIDRNAIDPALMTRDEIAWLDAYHARVREVVTPLVDAEAAAFLAKATRPLLG